MRPFRAQSAMEYLMTYSWMLLIIGIVLVIIFVVVNPNKIIGTGQCLLPAGLSCLGFYMATNGLMTINLLQATQTAINVTALSCNANNTAVQFTIPYNPPTNQIKMQIAANYTFPVQCWGGASKINGNPGTYFSGYLYINYTDAVTGFPHTVSGKIAVTIT